MLKLIANAWLARGLGFLGFASVIYVLGPLLAIGNWRPLESVAARAILVLLLVIVWLARHLLKAKRTGKAEKQLVEGVVAAPLVPAAPDASAEERGVIKQRFEEALAALKKSRGRKGRLSLHDLPWYIIIGPPGSGKTTALVNSGLRFPLANRFGPDAIRGIGGTRNCDWWFTDDAILIDTAGRYTTQDSDAKADQAGWLGFLDLLKKHRKRRPINGIFVALSVADLLSQTEQQRRAQILAIKNRVTELDLHFGMRFPVYVLFTKCDLVAGFMQFFDDLGRSEREQPWGITFPYSDDAEANPAERFGGEFDLLIRRLNERVLSRIGHERDPARRALLHGFPHQMLALKESCASFVSEIFQSSRFDKAPMLRGVYFTSGTQEGTPIDRLMGVLARTFQLDAQALPPQNAAGKSFFITDVLRNIAFPEAGLAGTNRRLELQRAWLQRGTYAAVAGIAALLVVAWVFAYLQSSAYVARMSDDVGRARELLAAVDSRNYDPLSVLPVLNAVRALPGGYADQLAGSAWFDGLGLSQRDKLGETATTSYRRLLGQLFFPRIMLRLENQLQRGSVSPDYTYEALKAYLMLDSQEHYDPAAIRAFVELDWDANLQREVGTEQRQALGGHLATLFEERPALPLPLNETVVTQARREVRSLPLDERIYGRLKRSFSAEVAGFNIRDAAGGPTAELVFIRKSGVPLATPLPGLFTKQAYQSVFVEQSRALTTELASESWILGEDEAVAGEEQERLLGRVRDRYLDEFAELYTNAVLDVGLVSFTTPDEAARVFNLLSRPDDSPLLLLLKELARQTSLDQTEQPVAAGGGATGSIAQLQDRLRGVIGAGAPRAANTPQASQAPNPVTERFKDLSALVEQREGQPRPVDHLLGLVQDLYRYLTVVASAAAGGSIPPQIQQQGQAVLQQLRVAAATQPKLLVGDLLATTVEHTTALTTGGLLSYLNELWRSGPLAVCRQAIAGRYPIAVQAEQTVPLADFGEFFGYGGHMDRFFNENLRPYVDATSSPWQPRVTANLPVQLSPAALRAFENADIVKRTFFRPGGMAPSVSFDLRPLEMDTALGRFLLDLEGKVVTYEFGPMTSALMQWPGPNPGSEVRLEFRDRRSGATEMTRATGPWAWFQVLGRSNLRATSVPEQFEVTFSQGGREVVYQLTARSAFNPFALSQLQQFQCPAAL